MLFEIFELLVIVGKDMDLFYVVLYDILVCLISVLNCYIVMFDESCEYLDFFYFSDIYVDILNRCVLGLGLMEFVICCG